LDAGSYILNTRSGDKERISRIYQMHANKQNPVEYIEAGDIGAAVGFKISKLVIRCVMRKPNRS
jgi:elongation factor G